MQLGVYSFGDRHPDPVTGERVSVADKLAQTVERIKLADELNLGFYGLGEHHLADYSISNTPMWDSSHAR